MAINPLQIPNYGPALDVTPQLSQFAAAIDQGVKKRTLADLGKGLADGTINYKQAAAKAATLGDLGSTMSLLKLGQEQDASKAFGNSLSSLYGLPAQSVPSLRQSSAGPVIPNDSNAFPGQAGMDARLADRSQDFIQDNPNTYLSSGVRSTADQARLYADRANNPNPVAAPGTSRHERGLAIDIGGMTPDQRAMLPQYGLAQPVANDPPHVELADTRMASNDPAAIPTNAQAAQGYAIPGQAAEPSGISPRAVQLIRALSIPGISATQKEIGGKLLAAELDQSKLPDAVKRYVYAKAQDPSIGTYTEWERANKAAGKTEVNIDQKAETGEAKAAGEAAGKRRAEMFAAAGSAGKTLTNLSRMEGLLNQVSQGKIQPARMNISAWAKSFGLNDDVAKSLGLDPKGVGSAQAVQSLINESVVGKIGQGGFPANNFSDADREFITKIFPSLGDDPRANQIRIEGARRMAQLDIERAKAFQQFKRDPANKGRGFEDFELDWSEKMAKRDVFGDLRREAESIIGAPRNDIGGTINNPGAAPSRGATGQWGNQQPPVQGARQAPDGKFYVPDPNRPGKYLEVR